MYEQSTPSSNSAGEKRIKPEAVTTKFLEKKYHERGRVLRAEDPESHEFMVTKSGLERAQDQIGGLRAEIIDVSDMSVDDFQMHLEKALAKIEELRKLMEGKFPGLGDIKGEPELRPHQVNEESKFFQSLAGQHEEMRAEIEKVASQERTDADDRAVKALYYSLKEDAVLFYALNEDIEYGGIASMADLKNKLTQLHKEVSLALARSGTINNS